MASIRAHERWDRIFVDELRHFEAWPDIDKAAGVADRAVPSIAAERKRKRCKRYPWWRLAYGRKKRGAP